MGRPNLAQVHPRDCRVNGSLCHSTTVQTHGWGMPIPTGQLRDRLPHGRPLVSNAPSLPTELLDSCTPPCTLRPSSAKLRSPFLCVHCGICTVSLEQLRQDKPIITLVMWPWEVLKVLVNQMHYYYPGSSEGLMMMMILLSLYSGLCHQIWMPALLNSWYDEWIDALQEH